LNPKPTSNHKQGGIFLLIFFEAGETSTFQQIFLSIYFLLSLSLLAFTLIYLFTSFLDEIG